MLESSIYAVESVIWRLMIEARAFCDVFACTLLSGWLASGLVDFPAYFIIARNHPLAPPFQGGGGVVVNEMIGTGRQAPRARDS